MAIPVVIVWLVITFSTGTAKISSSYFKLLIMTKQHDIVYKNGNNGANFLTNALRILSWTHAVRHHIFTYKFEQNLEWKASI